MTSRISGCGGCRICNECNDRVVILCKHFSLNIDLKMVYESCLSFPPFEDLILAEFTHTLVLVDCTVG